MSAVENGRLKAKRDQLFSAGETTPERLLARPFRPLCKSPAPKARKTHQACMAREFNLKFPSVKPLFLR